MTEQHPASARYRRATSVREVSKSKHEECSTRIVANYNHMHALTVQYFEVVQLYRIVSELHRVDRCIFVPLELLDFSGDAGMKTIERWRATLERVALNRHVQSDAAPVLRLWDERLARLAAKLLDRPLFRHGSDSLFVPEGTELVAINFDGVHIKTVILDRDASAAAADQSINVAANASMIDVVPPQRLIELDAIALTNLDAATAAGTMTLHCLYLGRALALPAVPPLLTAGTAAQLVLTLCTDCADR